MSDEPSSIREVLESLVAEAVGGRREGVPTEEELGEAYASALAQLTEAIHASVLEKHAEHLDEVRATDQGFRERNYRRWKGGFDMLAVLRQTSIESGQMFQQEFLRFPQFLHDPLLGVLMRLHAHACRVMGEVEALLLSGYPDGAHARWRTLHEIAVFSILIRHHGLSAAEDFIRYGLIETVNGMEGYQAIAGARGREPYSDEELAAAIELRHDLIARCGEGIQSSNGWARKYVGSSKFTKLQEAAGLRKWANDYKAASRSIHFDYREMRSLLGMQWR